ncbi:MAG: hypothetical protein HC921_06945 [Synechococcaceae cyanobacterium SM2_3_1]|nr:hypothetical protein [Synechococcaceae cyanobacterium SM2_3_1]
MVGLLLRLFFWISPVALCCQSLWQLSLRTLSTQATGSERDQSELLE